MRLHLTKLKKLLLKEKLDAALISSIPNIIYLTDFNHFSTDEREAFLLITPKNNYLFTDKRYIYAAQKHVKNFTICEIGHSNSVAEWIKKIAVEENIHTLGIEETNLTIAEHKRIIPKITKTKHFDLNLLRLIKSREEITAIKNACAIGDKAFEYIVKQIKVGMTEKEVALLLEIIIKQHHAELSFPTIVAFGENAAFIHHKTSDKKLINNTAILIDFGVRFKNYCSDMSRTFFFCKATHEQKKAYETVLRSQEKAIQFIKEKLVSDAEISLSAIDNVARDYIIKNNYDSFPHSLGHGIGLEVHEEPRLSPYSSQIMQSGMVFSIEPGIYELNQLGIRIEDIFAIQEDTLIQLTTSSRKFREINN